MAKRIRQLMAKFIWNIRQNSNFITFKCISNYVWSGDGNVLAPQIKGSRSQGHEKARQYKRDLLEIVIYPIIQLFNNFFIMFLG